MPVAMMTGGGSWFSRETARLLLDEGWHVHLSDIDQGRLDETLRDLNRPDRVTVTRLDVTNRDEVRAHADAVAASGGIDALVNVAGGSNYLQMPRLPFHEMDPANWDLILRPNIYGVLNCCHAVLPHMIAAGHGAIVNISSGMGLRGMARMSTYSASKFAIIGFTQSVCQEVGQYGVRINCIAPGSAESRWQPDLQSGNVKLPPLGTRTSARDVANAVVFLISDKASHITGACLDISGGTSLH
jgi:2-hydroxycyclohexanecarboxyl-CoA dehydrogenase